MTLFQNFFLGLVQGITEFLPVSSTGHLNLISSFFHVRPSLSFDVFLHLASLFSVIIFFYPKRSYFIKNFFYIVIATTPAALTGFLFKSSIETIFSSIQYLSLFFLSTSFFLISTKFIRIKKATTLSVKNSLLIGFSQALALLPGVSRSGVTISAALLLGLSPNDAFNFSFSLFIPAVIGSLVLSFADLSSFSLMNINYLTAFVTAFLVGLVSLKFLQKSLNSRHLWRFGVYTLILALVLAAHVFFPNLI